MHVEVKDNHVINEVLGGNTSAYSDLVDKYKSYVYTIAYKILNNDEDAEEAAQDTFIKGYQALSSFSGKSKYSTWLYRIAFNTSISYKRKRRIEVSGLESIEHQISSNDDTSINLKKQDQRAVIEKALHALNPLDSTIITLFYLKERNLEEISQITGLKISAIKVKLFRSRKRMAEKLKDHLSEEVANIL